MEKAEYQALKKEILDEVVVKLIPGDVITQYMIRTMDGPSELWRMRKQFASHTATNAFITYMFCMTSRTPSRFHLSRTTGQMFMSDLVPGMVQLFGHKSHLIYRLLRDAHTYSYAGFW